jgi:acetate kinase
MLLASDAPEAREAVELYCRLAARQIAGLVPALGGLDALVFTGGIGEHAAPVRERIIDLLRWIGDVQTCVIPTDEERILAEACRVGET